MTQLNLVRLVLKRSLEVSGAEPIVNYEWPQVSRILILRCKLTDDINSWTSYVICFTYKLTFFAFDVVKSRCRFVCLFYITWQTETPFSELAKGMFVLSLLAPRQRSIDQTSYGRWAHVETLLFCL